MTNLKQNSSNLQNQSNTNEENLLRTEKKYNQKQNIYQKITDLIIEQLKQGRIPWERPLINNCRPQNLISGHLYNGINPLILTNAKTPYFMTFKQAKQIKATIKKGAKSKPVVFWSIGSYKKENEDGELEDKKSFILKYYNVFNISDIENIPAKYLDKTHLNKTNNIEIQTAENIINNYPNPPKFEYCTGTPHYSPNDDIIRTPQKDYFKTSSHFYSTVFHEIGHSVGHKSRLNRFKAKGLSARFGGRDYAKEELTAELTASFLMAETGESVNIKNRTAYIQSWLTVLNNDNKLLISSAGKAEKAVNYILNKQVEIKKINNDKSKKAA